MPSHVYAPTAFSGIAFLNVPLPPRCIVPCATGAVEAALGQSEAATPPLVLDAAAMQELTPLATLKPVTSIDTLTSGLASIARLPYGTDVAPAIKEGGAVALAEVAEPSLTLYEFEGCPVRRPVSIRPCPLPAGSFGLPPSGPTSASPVLSVAVHLL